MKVLLDACVPRPLRKYLADHTVHTAQEMGWGQLKNGALLKEAESQLDAMIATEIRGGGLRGFRRRQKKSSCARVWIAVTYGCRSH